MNNNRIWVRPTLFVAFCAIATVVLLRSTPRVALGTSTSSDSTTIPRQLVSNAAVPKPALLTADQIFKLASPAVVKIVVRDKGFRIIGQGSGFYVTADGRIITNFHVIKDAYFATVVEANGWIRAVDAVSAMDSHIDLAVLRVNRADGPFLKLAASLPDIGTRVYAVGNPLGLTNTLSEGIVSGMREDSSSPAMQTTAAISPGSSGGPLVGEDGSVVGVTTAAITSGQALNFAVPVTQVGSLLARQNEGQSLALVHTESLSQEGAQVLSEVWDLMTHGDLAAALKRLEPLRETEEKNTYFWITLGTLHVELNNDQQAIEAFDRAIALAPNDVVAHFARGLELSRLERWREAIEDLRCANELGENGADLFYWAGYCYQEVGDKVRAEAFFHRTIELNGRYDRAYSGLAHLRADEGQIENALDLIGRAIALNPGEASYYLNEGAFYSREKEYDKALSAWQNAVRFDPNGTSGRSAQKRIDIVLRARSR
jgi:Flp pilus assembly protein TadD